MVSYRNSKCAIVIQCDNFQRTNWNRKRLRKMTRFFTIASTLWCVRWLWPSGADKTHIVRFFFHIQNEIDIYKTYLVISLSMWKKNLTMRVLCGRRVAFANHDFFLPTSLVKQYQIVIVSVAKMCTLKLRLNCSFVSSNVKFFFSWLWRSKAEYSY